MEAWNSLLLLQLTSSNDGECVIGFHLHFSQANGRAEVPVKKAKRTLMDNVSPSGYLDDDGLLRALLQIRNTAHTGCIFISRKEKFNNPSVQATWREAWALKEDAMRAQMPCLLDKLSEHA